MAQKLRKMYRRDGDTDAVLQELRRYKELWPEREGRGRWAWERAGEDVRDREAEERGQGGFVKRVWRYIFGWRGK